MDEAQGKEDTAMNIADRIQNLRKTKGISQEQLAEALGVSRQAISKWESEQAAPELDKIILLSDYFDTTTDYILKGIEPTRDTDHKTIGDVIDQKILTITNARRLKKILKWGLIAFACILAIDLLALCIYIAMDDASVIVHSLHAQ